MACECWWRETPLAMSTRLYCGLPTELQLVVEMWPQSPVSVGLGTTLLGPLGPAACLERLCGVKEAAPRHITTRCPLALLSAGSLGFSGSCWGAYLHLGKFPLRRATPQFYKCPFWAELTWNSQAHCISHRLWREPPNKRVWSTCLVCYLFSCQWQREVSRENSILQELEFYFSQLWQNNRVNFSPLWISVPH